MMTFLSSGSSEEDVNQYAHNSVSSIEATQGKSSCEVITTTDVTDCLTFSISPTRITLPQTKLPMQSDIPTSTEVTANVPQVEPDVLQLSALGVDPPTSSNAAIFRNSFQDSVSDVLSLGECTKLPDPNPLFTEIFENRVAVTGESGFTVLHQPQQLSGQVDDFETDTADGDQCNTNSRRANTVLNTLDPIPRLRRLCGPCRSLLKKLF